MWREEERKEDAMREGSRAWERGRTGGEAKVRRGGRGNGEGEEKERE